jgi:hypothetical protein
MQITRRELLEIAAWLAAAPAAAQTKDADALEGARARAAETIRGYSAEGFHRTATAVDRASGDRLLALAKSAGVAASLEPFELSRVDPVAAFLEIDGQRIDGLPMFDGAFTNADGVSGAIGAIGGGRPIAFARIAPNAEVALRKIRDASPHRAIVAVTMGGKAGLCPVNAASFTAPFGPPVMQVGSEHLATVELAAASGRDVRVVAQVSRRTEAAVNVVGEVRGVQPGLSPVCVMTPRSGWHANASERGGGLASWLEAMRAVVAAHRPAESGRDVAHDPAEAGHYVQGGAAGGLLRTVKFVASSGHELGHLGLHAYLERNAGLSRAALAWVHLGANIGASTGNTGLTVSDDRLGSAAAQALSARGLERVKPAPAAQVGGEAATIGAEGGRFISFIGQNAWFHNPRDLWPDAVDIRAVAQFARAIGDLTVSLANTPA